MTPREEEEQLYEARIRLAHALQNPYRLGDVDRPGPIATAIARRPGPYLGAVAALIASATALGLGRRRAAKRRRAERRWAVTTSATTAGVAAGFWLGARLARSRAA